MLNKLYLLLFIGPFCFAQVGIYGDVYIAADQILAIHTPATHFVEGIVRTDSNLPGHVSFMPNNHGIAPHAGSHVDANVVSIETPEFVFPTGNQGVYQPLKISEGDAAALSASFEFSAHSNKQLSGDATSISNRFYWNINGDKNAKISLSWNTFSEIDSFTDEIEALVILGFNGNSWETIEAQLDPLNFDGSPTSISSGAIISKEKINFSQYEALTLGAVTLSTAIEVNRGLTPNGDGINDVWFIENIENYPQAQVRVYNRWGVEVYAATQGYNNDWRGTYKNDILPAGSYYYIIDLEADNKIDREGWLYISE